MDNFDLENPFTTLLETFSSLFSHESDHMPSENYFRSLQSRDLEFFRREAISMILQLNRDFGPFLSYLAINYLDRFLSSQGVPQSKPWILRLLAVSCLSLAAKMSKTEFSITDLQCDEGFIFDPQTIQRMESLILGALKWRMRSITPLSFVPYFISLFQLKDPPLRQALKDRATEIIFKSQNEINVLEFKPSDIAASALLSASHELFPLQFACFRNEISSCSYVNKEKLMNCFNAIDDIARDGYESVLDMAWSSVTPANILDLRCLSYESELIITTTAATTTTATTAEAAVNTKRAEKGIKRRKIGEICSENATFQLSQIQQC